MRTLLILALAATAVAAQASVTFTSVSAQLNSSNWPTSLDSNHQSLSGSASASGTSASLSIEGYLLSLGEINYLSPTRYDGNYQGFGTVLGNYVAQWTPSLPTDVAPSMIHVHMKVYHLLHEIIGANRAQGGGSLVSLYSHSFINATAASGVTGVGVGDDLPDISYKGEWLYSYEDSNNDEKYELVSEQDF